MRARLTITAIAGAVLIPSVALAAEGGGEPAGTWRALIFYVINFGLFVGILWKYAVPATRNFFRQRAVTIRETLAKADSAFREAEELANRAAERTAKLEAEKSQIASDMADETVFQIGRIYDLAQEAAARIKRDSEMSVVALHESGTRRVREALAQAAGRLAFEMIARNFVADDQTRLVAGFVDKLHQEAGR
jgi:F0F1-type ATP synthase membrane subunit b/b'